MSGFTEDIVSIETEKVGNILDGAIDTVADGAKERTAALDKLHGKVKDFGHETVELFNPFKKISQNPDDDDILEQMEKERIESGMSVDAFFFHKWMEKDDTWKFYIGFVSTRMFRFVLGHYIFDKRYQEQMISSRKVLIPDSDDQAHNVPPNISQFAVMMKDDASLRNLEYFVNTLLWKPDGKNNVFVAVVRSNDEWRIKGREPQKMSLGNLVDEIRNASKNTDDRSAAFSYFKFVREQHSETHIASFNQEVEKLKNSKILPIDFLKITKFFD